MQEPTDASLLKKTESAGVNQHHGEHGWAMFSVGTLLALLLVWTVALCVSLPACKGCMEVSFESRWMKLSFKCWRLQNSLRTVLCFIGYLLPNLWDRLFPHALVNTLCKQTSANVFLNAPISATVSTCTVVRIEVIHCEKPHTSILGAAL